MVPFSEQIELDFKYLRSIAGEDSSFAVEVLKHIESQTRLTLDQLKKSYSINDWQACAGYIHFLVGSVGLVTSESVQAKLRQTENLIRKGEINSNLKLKIENSFSICSAVLSKINEGINSPNTLLKD